MVSGFAERERERGGGARCSFSETRVLRALLDVEGHLPSTRPDEEEEVTLPPPVEYQLVHASRHGLEVATKFGEGELNAPPSPANAENQSRYPYRGCESVLSKTDYQGGSLVCMCLTPSYLCQADPQGLSLRVPH